MSTKRSPLLGTYKKKRDFKKTPEPLPLRKKSSKKKVFVIQKHQASHLHFDFRLELQGVLKSWAVPKGPPLDTAERRLAIHVEDHPLNYLNFEGNIPDGNYGAGTVMVWDNGTYDCGDEDPLKAYKSGKMAVNLRGQKLSGTWILIRIKNDDKNWLILKSKTAEVLAKGRKLDKSVASGRSMNQIKRDKN